MQVGRLTIKKKKKKKNWRRGPGKGRLFSRKLRLAGALLCVYLGSVVGALLFVAS
jgi:hypothetical protein